MIYFVTEKFLKDRTQIADNVDIKRVSPCVETVSDIRIQPLLGEYFYNDLLTKYNAETLNANETTLVKMMQRAIAWYAAGEAVYSVSRPISNKGIQQQDGENSSAVDLEELAFGMDHFKQKGLHYVRRITSYLKKNAVLFPVFTDDLNKDSDLFPETFSDLDEGFNDSIVII